MRACCVHNNADFLPIIDNHNHAVALIDADSAYCKPLMADDWLYPECLEEMVRCAVAHPDVGLVCCLARAADQRILYDRLRQPDAPMPTQPDGAFRAEMRRAYRCSRTGISSARPPRCSSARI